MERQRQMTIAQLQKEGVWDMNREAPMPVVVQRVAVVSSANAAGYQDFRKELAKSPYRFEVTLFDAFMQGAAAEESIVTALCAVAERMDEFDAVVPHPRRRLGQRPQLFQRLQALRPRGAVPAADP